MFKITVMLLPLASFAQDPSWQDKFQELIDKIPLEGAFVAGAAMIIDLIFRVVKTEKPKGILYMISDGVKLLAKGLEKVGALLDKILPQRLK